MLRMSEELLRRIGLDNLALVHEYNAVRYLAGKTHFMRYDQHSHTVMGEYHHRIEHFLHHLWIQRW